ncbi:MAG: hypothetical protein WBI55_08080, partial [Eubacteriales bacterium]
YNIRSFYENFMKYSDIPYEDWYRLIFDTNNYKTILPSHKINTKGMSFVKDPLDGWTDCIKM